MSNTCRDVNELYHRLARVAEEEYPDIVEYAEVRRDRLRLHIMDGSFVDCGLVGGFHANTPFTGSDAT